MKQRAHLEPALEAPTSYTHAHIHEHTRILVYVVKSKFFAVFLVKCVSH